MSTPRILLAKPGTVPAGSTVGNPSRSEDESVVIRSRINSLSLISESWDIHIDRVLPFMTENTDFTVVGVIGSTGVGKSTILNELYGFDRSSAGMLPPFATQSEESRAMARHCTVGVDMRISAERLILLDTQPVFSPSVLIDIMRPDGSSAIPVLNGESLSADLAHELAGIQLGVFLASVCHILLVISEGVSDTKMCQLMSTVNLLKHGIPDPSFLASHPGIKQATEEGAENLLQAEYFCIPVFIHTKLQNLDFCSRYVTRLRTAVRQYFSSSFETCKTSGTSNIDGDVMDQNLFLLPHKFQDDSQTAHYHSFTSTLEQLCNQILSMNVNPFAKTISERDWLRNSARIWEIVRSSPDIADYSRTLQHSGLFRR